MLEGRLKGKKILVTGGSRGIGAEIAKRLAFEGAEVAITFASNGAAAEKVLTGLPKNQKHFMVQMELSNPESVEQAFAKVLESFGTLHGLVNNAGVTRDQLLLRMSAKDFSDVIETNLFGVFFAAKLALKPMLKNRDGAIVNLSSVVAHSGNPGQTNYSASKAGIEGFTRSLALEVASRNIRVNCVAPGFIATDMTEKLDDRQREAILSKVPMARLGTPQEISGVVSFLLSDDARYMTGQTLHANGGLYM